MCCFSADTVGGQCRLWRVVCQCGVGLFVGATVPSDYQLMICHLSGCTLLTASSYLLLLWISVFITIYIFHDLNSSAATTSVPDFTSLFPLEFSKVLLLSETHSHCLSCLGKSHWRDTSHNLWHTCGSVFSTKTPGFRPCKTRVFGVTEVLVTQGSGKTCWKPKFFHFSLRSPRENLSGMVFVGSRGFLAFLQARCPPRPDALL